MGLGNMRAADPVSFVQVGEGARDTQQAR